MPERFRFFGEDSERNIEAFINEFEPNSFNVKGLTGCGATTMLLENHQPMILSCPTNELCDCKTNAERHSGVVLWYKKGVSDDDIRKYIETVDVPKFIVVYDRTDHLHQALSRIHGDIVCVKYVLAIDEAHMLMTALAYRDKAIKKLQKLFPRFSNTQFITATPVPAEFTPEIFRDYNYVEYEWEGAKKVNVVTYNPKFPINAVCNLIERFKTKGYIKVDNEENTQIKVDELIFFINSVKDIATIIKTSKLNSEECKVIVADKYSNIEMISRAFGIEQDELKIARASEPNKKFTFVTSKAFEGVDFYSESALSIVVSKVDSKNTLMDMGVSLPQIAGRIRTPENTLKDTILFIFNTSSYGKSLEEQEKEISSEIAEAKECIEIYESCETESKRNALQKRYSLDFNHGYLYPVETEGQVEIYLDLDAIKLKRYQNYITRTYSSRLKVLNTIRQKSNVIEEEDYYEENVVLSYVSNQPFNEVVKEYIQMKLLAETINDKLSHEEMKSNRERLEKIEKETPLLVEAFLKLGPEKMQTAGNRGIKCLNEALTEYEKKVKLRIGMQEKFKVDRFYTNSDITKVLKAEYFKKGIVSTAKATDITFFFEVEKIRRTNPIKSKLEWGYLIKKSIQSNDRSLLSLIKRA